MFLAKIIIIAVGILLLRALIKVSKLEVENEYLKAHKNIAQLNHQNLGGGYRQSDNAERSTKG